MRTRFSDISAEDWELYKEAIREQAIEYANAQGKPCFFSNLQAMLDEAGAHPIFYSALGDAVKDSE